MNNNNNNNIILPTYLQKYLIKIICNHINKKNKTNKLYPIEEVKKDEVEKEIQFKQSIALVCKTWFNCLSNNLTVCKDFIGLSSGGVDNEFSILKRDNITILKLINYNNEDLEFDLTLKKKINQLKNLEKIKVCRYFSQKQLVRKPQTFNLEFLNKVFKSNTPTCINGEIKIDLHISLYCNYFGFPEIPYASKCQFNVNKLKIDSCCDEESSFAIMDYIKYFNPNKLSIVPSPSLHTSNDPHFKYKKIIEFDQNTNSGSDSSNQTFSFLEKLSISKLSLQDVLSIKEIYFILKSLPNLKSLSFQMCQRYMISKFTKDELSKPRSNQLWQKPDFYFYFERVREMLIYHKSLSSLTIGTGCKNKCCKNINLSQQQDNSIFNQTFSEIISSNKSIRSLSLLNFNNNEIINNISSFKNLPIKTIK